MRFMQILLPIGSSLPTSVRRTVWLAVCSLPLTVTCPIEASPVMDDAIVHRDIEYARPQGVPLLLDVIQPGDTQQPTPVVVFVHGGGWKNGDKKSGHKQAAWLVEHGFSVVTINYRLTDVAQWPAQMEDCCEAVRWVRRNADEYRFDPHHVAAWGTSAGGRLVGDDQRSRLTVDETLQTIVVELIQRRLFARVAADRPT